MSNALEFAVENMERQREENDLRAQDDAAFLERCKPDLEAIEEIRLVKLRSYNFRKIVGGIAAMTITPFLGYIDFLLLHWQTGDDKAAGLSIAFMSFLYWWVTQPKRQYAAEHKKRTLPKIVKLFGDFMYDIKGCVSLEDLKSSKILPSYDRHKSEDHFTGNYKGVGLEFGELHLEERRGSGKNRRYVTVFKGVVIIIDLKFKKFLGHTILQKNGGAISQWFVEMSNKLKRAHMVDPEFEKIFDVYTNDQVEARWLIDPVMIEKLKGLYEEYEGERMLAAYYESKMMIMIGSKHNHFEPASLHTPATEPDSLLSMKREIGQTLSIIDKLSLYDPTKAHTEI